MKVGGKIPWNVTPICETSQVCYLMGRRHMKDVCITVKNPSVWKESFAWIVPRIRSLRGVNLKGDILVADLEELETMDASEIYSKRLNAKEVIFPKQGEFIFQSQMDESKHPEEIRN